MSISTGVYKSEDTFFTIDIHSFSGADGNVEAIYHSYDPQSPFTAYSAELRPVGQPDILLKGNFSWVNNQSGGNGSTPFAIMFFAQCRTPNWPYCIYDTWVGAYESDQTGDYLIMTGSHAYIYSDGTAPLVTGYGTLKFTKQDDNSPA